MGQSHPLHMSVNTGSGNRGLFWLLPFAGDGRGRHTFNDHSHARNFIRYLFSQSVAHPENNHTRRNLFREFSSDTALHREAYNEDPRANLNDFLRRRFPARDGHKGLYDDGCYPMFILQAAGQPMISNFVSREIGKDPDIRHPLLDHLKSYLKAHGGSWGAERKKIIAFGGDTPVRSFDAERDEAVLRSTEIFVQAVVRKLMGNGQGVMMTVAHRDQHDHNPCYHIHRLVREEAEAPSP